MTSAQETRDEAGERSVSRRQALTFAGAAAAGAVATGMAATPAAARESSGAGKSVASFSSVTLAGAQRIVKAGVDYVRAHSGIPPMFILVVDASGDEKASGRMDGNSPASPVLVPIKARTALAFRTSTATLASRTTDPARIASFTTAGFSLLGGGVPIVVDGVVVGAVGVGGGTPEQDDEVARNAINAGLK